MLALAGILGSPAMAGPCNPGPHDIATSFDLPGKGGWTTCVPFSTELYRRLTGAGYEAHYLVYAWKSGAQRGKHALVIYRDRDGRYWAMDNRMSQPRWIRGDDVASWLNSLKAESGMEAMVVTHATNGQRPPAAWNTGVRPDGS
jgi:hypothetical protein